MLTLPIKKKWYDMILSGEKKEEYRENKSYWDKRFRKVFLYACLSEYSDYPTLPYGFDEHEILFRNGYSKNSPCFIATCTLSIGTGREEWGAEKDKQYFVLTIHKIMEDKINPGCKVGTEAAG